VRVVLTKDETTGAEKLGFEFLDGRVTPKPEQLPEPRKARTKTRRVAPRKPKPPGPRGDGGGKPNGRTVPKVPLKV
jgi:ATP-dependent Clp protease ATP-binding subunit ClpA